MRCLAAIAAAALMLAGCNERNVDSDRPKSAQTFPRADRAVSQLGGSTVASETERDSVNEAQSVMDLADIRKGMTVADIGAGDGYYTVRLAERVGADGRVLAQDIDSNALRRLGLRVERERLDNVSIKEGAADDPHLPTASFDRVFLVHMYHEVTEPYAFLWRLYPALNKGGKVIVVEVDRATDQHGIPPALLFCEFAAVGFRLAEFVRKPELQGYYAQFEVASRQPAPSEIKSCRASDEMAAAKS